MSRARIVEANNLETFRDMPPSAGRFHYLARRGRHELITDDDRKAYESYQNDVIRTLDGCTEGLHAKDGKAR